MRRGRPRAHDGGDDLPTHIDEQLTAYLADAHAIEEQAEALLERGPALSGYERLAAIYEEHLAETREHAELVEERLQVLGGDASSSKDAALRLGALNWAAFFRGHPDTPGEARGVRVRLRAPRDRRVRAAEARGLPRGDTGTVDLVERILVQERAAAARIAAAFDAAASESLETLGVVG